jgi:hypothetical protein|tara:strand:+ start:188 stop:469 length:282 start_codon:yes stop_codon:yes gene_type:complete
MKKFFSMKLKQGWNENVPLELAKKLIVTESPFVEYLHKKKVLKIRHIKSRNCIDLYADEKHLMIAKLKFGKVFSGKMGFIELFIMHQLKKKWL